MPEITAELVAECIAVADEVRLQLLDDAILFAPVDTGELADSGHIDGDYVIFDATNDQGVPYGGFVEFGTAYTPAQPFMGPAVDMAEALMNERMAEVGARF